MSKLYSERHGKAKLRVAEFLDEGTRHGLLSLVIDRVEEEWFGFQFPAKCDDGYPYAGTDRPKLYRRIRSYDVVLPDKAHINNENPPDDGQVFDLIELSYELISEPKFIEHHKFMGHSHYTYDQEAGRKKFACHVNSIFERNGMAFHFNDGEVTRIAPSVMHEILDQATFNTGDIQLDGLLEGARNKYLNRSLLVRREALEKLWDAWERLKSLEVPKNKKESVKILLDKAATEQLFRETLERDACELTSIGNHFMIRHTEVDRTPISGSEQIDYFFFRMFSMIWLLLRTTGRVL